MAAMRGRIQGATGVSVPGINYADIEDSREPGEYRVQIFGRQPDGGNGRIDPAASDAAEQIVSRLEHHLVSELHRLLTIDVVSYLLASCSEPACSTVRGDLSRLCRFTYHLRGLVRQQKGQVSDLPLLAAAFLRVDSPGVSVPHVGAEFEGSRVRS